ncbi:hypothetical protein PLIP_a2281 [Pseudoalteromonas lipolytica LMEB 39]|nr:hypothetical protein [Pseudoalteromonas lipolytica LMEB 39]
MGSVSHCLIKLKIARSLLLRLVGNKLRFIASFLIRLKTHLLDLFAILSAS